MNAPLLATEGLTAAAKRLIGCSDYPPVLGLCEPGPVGLYNRVRHGIETPRPQWLTEMGELGKLTEFPTAIAAARKLRLDPSKLEKIPTIINPGGREWARVSLDPAIRSPATLFECKSRASWRLDDEGWGDEGTDQIPLEIWCQVQGQFDAIRADRDASRWRGTDLPDIDTIYVAVLVNGQKILIFAVRRAADRGAAIAERMRKFWMDHVKRGVPPILDHLQGSLHYLASHFKKSNKVIRDALPHEAEAAREFLDARAERDRALERFDTLKAEVLEIIGTDYGIKGPGFKLTAPEYKGKLLESEIVDALSARLHLTPEERSQIEEFHRGDRYRVLRAKEED